MIFIALFSFLTTHTVQSEFEYRNFMGDSCTFALEYPQTISCPKSFTRLTNSFFLNTGDTGYIENRLVRVLDSIVSLKQGCKIEIELHIQEKYENNPWSQKGVQINRIRRMDYFFKTHSKYYSAYSFSYTYIDNPKGLSDKEWCSAHWWEITFDESF